MPNHQTHFTIGLLFYPAIFLVWNLIFNFIGSDYVNFFNMKDIAISIFIYGIGTILPDVDIQSSLIHRVVRNLFIIPGVVCLVYYLLKKYLLGNFVFHESIVLIIETIAMYMAVLIGFMSGWLFSKSVKHRGFLHSPLAALLYGGVVFGSLALFQFEVEDAVFLAIMAASSYFIHIVTDFVSPLFRRGK